MPTNRKRMVRTPKSKIPQKITKTYREKLRLKDFLGQLEDAEIPVAAKAGVLRWDLWEKAGKIRTLTAGQHHNNFRTAPLFDGCNPIFEDGIRYLINDYAELAVAR